MSAEPIMLPGPQAMDRAERLALAHAIADRARARYGDQLRAVGLYGSMARGTDGPYSDIEIFCILSQPGVEFSHEWSAGPWKAEVDFYGEDVLLAKAAEVEGRWPQTHGAFHTVLPLYDPDGLFARLRETAMSRTPDQFRAAIEGVLVGELYEFIAKVRNMAHRGHFAHLPERAILMAKYGAFLIGLHNRRYFSTGGLVLEEALALPDRPEGFDALCQFCISGQLADSAAVVAACERFWAGVIAWAEGHGYRINAEEQIPF